jgi:hypothetical protein
MDVEAIPVHKSIVVKEFKITWENQKHQLCIELPLQWCFYPSSKLENKTGHWLFQQAIFPHE